MDNLYISNKNGVINSLLDYDLSLERLIFLIKKNYPQIEDELILVINKGVVLQDYNKKLSEQGVNVNIDRLRVIPATIWNKFS